MKTILYAIRYFVVGTAGCVLIFGLPLYLLAEFGSRV